MKSKEHKMKKKKKDGNNRRGMGKKGRHVTWGTRPTQDKWWLSPFTNA